MKKKLLALLLAAALLLALPAADASADSHLYFFSVNDTLPPELVNCVFFSGGNAYAPYYVFSSYGLGLSASTAANGALCLSSGGQQLYFNLKTGECYDDDNYHYSAAAASRNGTTCVPLSFVCVFFGLSYSTISAGDYGTIFRIANGSVVLTDAEFLRAAQSALQSYSAGYENGLLLPGEETDAHRGDRLQLNFIGLPDDTLLSLLALNDAQATFFLSAADVLAQPDTVRRLYCQGHALGVYCESDLAADYAETADLLFETARCTTLLVTAPADYAEACSAQAEMAGLVYCAPKIDAAGAKPLSSYQIFRQLAAEESGSISLRFGNSAADLSTLSSLFSYLRSMPFSLSVIRETD